MTSRERVLAALDHREADRVPLDLGGTILTSMHASVVYKLRQALALDPLGTPVKIIEPFQMLGEVASDLSDAIGCDVVSCAGSGTLFGIENKDWKEWDFNGTPVLVPGAFNTEPNENGDILQYPCGDRSAPPSGRMPKGGYYCDMIIRQEPIVEEKLNIEDNLVDFPIMPDGAYDDAAREAAKLMAETDKLVFGVFGGAQFGEVAILPGPALREPKGIRDINEWYMSLLVRPQFIHEWFEEICRRALLNLEQYHRAAGDNIQVIGFLGTDFGSQAGPLYAEEVYCEFFKPYQKRINDWIHQHTNWKTFLHSCGSVRSLIKQFIEEGFDILNPVQCTAAQMRPQELKDEFGDKIVFWGGGADTQATLPFGTPQEVREQTRERLAVFGRGGGYVFNPVHNVQANTPIENVLAMLESFREHSAYPLELLCG